MGLVRSQVIRRYVITITWHLFCEQKAASILNIPCKEVCINPSGLYQRSAPREPVSKIVHWNGWKH